MPHCEVWHYYLGEKPASLIAAKEINLPPKVYAGKYVIGSIDWNRY